MLWGDVQLLKDADSAEHLLFFYLKDKLKPDLPRKRDIVAVFKIYCEKRPVHEQTRCTLFLDVNYITKISA